MKKVKKAVIPAAGLGTRLLPATKAMAKEMLPIVDKPTIQYIVEEALASGIEEILIVTGKSKRPIEDHFDSNIELESNLESKGKTELLELVQETTGIKLYFVRQSYPKGLGDDIVKAEIPLTRQLIEGYEKTHASNIAVMEIPMEDTNKYGIIEPESKVAEDLYNVRHFVEKPKPEDAPSNLAIIGRYLLTPEIFEILEKQEPGAGGEIQLTDAIDTLNQTQRVFAKKFEGTRYDVGNKLGYMTTSIEFGLEHPEIKDELKDYIIDLAHRLEGKTSSNKVVESTEKE